MSLGEKIIVFKNNACMLGGKTIEQGDACAICIDAFCDGDPVFVTACKHVFHAHCVVMHFWKRPRDCPVCCGDAYGTFAPEWAKAETSDARLMAEYLRGERDAKTGLRALAGMLMVVFAAIVFCSFFFISHLKDQQYLAEQNTLCDDAHPTWQAVCRTRFRYDAQSQFCDLVHPSWRHLCRSATPEQLERLNSVGEAQKIDWLTRDVTAGCPGGIDRYMFLEHAIAICKPSYDFVGYYLNSQVVK